VSSYHEHDPLTRCPDCGCCVECGVDDGPCPGCPDKTCGCNDLRVIAEHAIHARDREWAASQLPPVEHVPGQLSLIPDDDDGSQS